MANKSKGKKSILGVKGTSSKKVPGDLGKPKVPSTK